MPLKSLLRRGLRAKTLEGWGEGGRSVPSLMMGLHGLDNPLSAAPLALQK